jgi:hypothetical protein
VTVRDAEGNLVSGAKVFGRWSTGHSDDCTTNSNGQCELERDRLEGQITSVDLWVENVTHQAALMWVYDAASNCDADGDSDGTTISIARPW